MQQVKVALFSHTHWDREWYRTFQEFRFGLVNVIDQILNLLQAGEYENFILDGQTVVLEDYLEICPDLKKSLAGWIKKGKLVIGPWYILPDEFLISGESIVRNLLLGKSIAEDFGKSQTIGYLPDMFGHIAQMPQIMKGFGIDKALVWRGVNPEKCLFIWKGLDQSEITTVHLSEGYYNTFLINYDKQKKDLAEHLEKLEKHSYGDLILFPNGGDHLAPPQDLKAVLKDIGTEFPRYKFFQSTLEEYFHHLQINENDLEIISGELRNPQRAYILPGVFSARMYLKQRNHKLQSLLSNWVEPLASLNWLLGNEYNQGFINLAWKNLLLNQPHDSICGCSIDQVHKEMIQRYDHGDEICGKLIEKTMESIASSVSTSIENYCLLAFNMSNWEYSGSEEFNLDFPAEEKVESFKLVDNTTGQEINYQVLEKTDMKKFVSEINVLPDWIEIRRFKIALKLEKVIPFGFKTIGILVNRENTPLVKNPGLKAVNDSIENQFTRLSLEKGKLAVESLINGNKYFVNSFESSGDAGDEYNYSPPINDILSNAFIINSEIEYQTNNQVTLKINYSLKLPEQLAEDRKSLSNNFVNLEITSYVTLKADDPLLYIKTRINNVARDHRLRVNFGVTEPDPEKLKYTYDTQFGLLEKAVKANEQGFDMDKYKERIEEVAAIQTFADLSNDNSGLAVFTKGLPEVELISRDEKFNLSLTLLRCVGWLSRDDLRTRGGGAGPAMPTPDAQCQGLNTFEYAIYPHNNNLQASDVIIRGNQYVSGIRLLQFKPSADGQISLSEPLLKLEPENLVVSCLKRSEDQDGVIFRFYNPLPEKQDFYVKPAENFSFMEVSSVRLDEHILESINKDDQGNYYGVIEPYQIISLEFVPNTI
jgi:mannosylglycerate hydrolase